MTPYQRYLIEQALEEEYLEESKTKEKLDDYTKRAFSGDKQKFNAIVKRIEQRNKPDKSLRKNPIRSRGGRSGQRGVNSSESDRSHSLGPDSKTYKKYGLTVDTEPVASRSTKKNKKNKALGRGYFGGFESGTTKLRKHRELPESYYLTMLDILAESGYLETTEDLYALAEAALYLLED